jgi:hypothetical protein
VIEGVFAGIGTDEAARLRETLSRIKGNLTDMLETDMAPDTSTGGETRS